MNFISMDDNDPHMQVGWCDLWLCGFTMVVVDRWVGPGPGIQASSLFLYLFTFLFGLAKNIQQVFLGCQLAKSTARINRFSEVWDLGSGKASWARFFSLDRHHQSLVECYLRSQARKGRVRDGIQDGVCYSLSSLGTLTR